MNILLTTLISLVMTYEMPKLPYANIRKQFELFGSEYRI